MIAKSVFRFLADLPWIHPIHTDHGFRELGADRPRTPIPGPGPGHSAAVCQAGIQGRLFEVCAIVWSDKI